MKIHGIVIKGEGKGRKLGFPTVNLDVGGMGIESGIYAGVVRFGDSQYSAGIFVSRDKKTLEAHLIGFNSDLYGQEVEVEIGEKIREVRDFDGENELIKQIGEDMKSITNN